MQFKSMSFNRSAILFSRWLAIHIFFVCALSLRRSQKHGHVRFPGYAAIEAQVQSWQYLTIDAAWSLSLR